MYRNNLESIPRTNQYWAVSVKFLAQWNNNLSMTHEFERMQLAILRLPVRNVNHSTMLSSKHFRAMSQNFFLYWVVMVVTIKFIKTWPLYIITPKTIEVFYSIRAIILQSLKIFGTNNFLNSIKKNNILKYLSQDTLEILTVWRVRAKNI